MEGIRFTGTLVGRARPDIRIGMPVELVWIDRHGSPFPAFSQASVGGGA